jgi:hypothetical protein
MPLQTDNLVMAGLGVRGDVPPNAVQPPLPDGIHLRWSFLAELGFPWHGFFLFRRLHQPGRPVCLGQTVPSPEAWPRRDYASSSHGNEVRMAGISMIVVPVLGDDGRNHLPGVRQTDEPFESDVVLLLWDA